MKYVMIIFLEISGHVEAGESEIETAYRETEEEAGLTRSHIKVLDGFQKTLRYPVRGKNKRVEYWLAELLDPNTPVVLSNEHIDFKWLPLDDCKTFARFPEMIEAYEEAEKFIVTTN